ncbi:MAG: hypothetical protein D6718_03005 [Acidobacteria bacterium]|nr:MAG: hypothetical protein D6718_03005 [Acidobacteriota bacterium]
MKCARAAGLAAVLAWFALPAAMAGELALEWPPSGDELTAGYDVELLDEDGTILRTFDAGRATTVRLRGLADGRRYGVRVRPYDIWGNRAREATRTLVTMPEPRIEALEGRLEPGRWVLVTLRGSNFDDGAVVLSRRAGLTAGDVTVIDSERLLVELRAEPGVPAPGPGDLLVVNPVRRAPSYLAARPELLDVDRSGRVDAADLEAVLEAFGTVREDPDYRPQLDPNGDGVIDGEDAGLIRARLAQGGDTLPSAP